MKRFILSVFCVVLATGAVAPSAQALPQLDPSFNLQTLRLREFDTRNRLANDAYIPEASGQTSESQRPQQEWSESEGSVEVEKTTTGSANASNASIASDDRLSSLTERRLDTLNRN